MVFYCRDCKTSETKLFESDTARMPSFFYCEHCFRAYNLVTGEPLRVFAGNEPIDRVYYDRTFTQFDDAGNLVTGRLVAHPIKKQRSDKKAA